VLNPRIGRAAAVLAGVVALTAAIAGCSVGGSHTGSSGQPAVGDCWRTSYDTSQKSEDWEGAAAVPCTQKHESYTFAVAHVSAKLTGSWLTAKNTVRTAVDDAAYAACQREAAIDLPGLQTLGLLRVNYYVPSVALWTDGARWVRCDLTRIKVGSEVQSPVLDTLPPHISTLESALNTTPKKFDLCEDDLMLNGPDGAATTFADCTGPADWTFAAAVTLDGAKGAAYPGTAALKAIGAKDCLVEVDAGGHDIFPEVPSAASWTKFDDRELDCWVNNN
jgi:Septum formation